MKTTKILAILVLTLYLIVCWANVSNAASMGRAFTYQGRLMRKNRAAKGLYDFRFKIFDDQYKGIQLGSGIDIYNLDVIKGYFTTELDFGDDPNIFNSEARWLEIDVRPSDSNDPNDFVTLSPRQEITPTPYALYAMNADHIPGGVTGSGTANYMTKFIGPNTVGDSVIYESTGNVGIGTTNPAGKLEVVGNAHVRNDLVVKGAYYGTIGPNNGAPFPRPAFDSGWRDYGVDRELVTIFHNIGGNVDNYIVDTQWKEGANILGDRTLPNYQNLTTSSIMVYSYTHRLVRVRIWVYN